MEHLGTLNSTEKTIVTSGDRWWAQAVKQEGDNSSETFLCNTWKPRNERPTDGGVSSRGRNGAGSRKGCMRGQRSKMSTRPTPSPRPPSSLPHEGF